MTAITDTNSAERAVTPRELAPELEQQLILWTETVPGGGHFSCRVRRGTTLRFVDLEGGANVALLMFRADERLERMNLPDSLKAQHTAHLTTGNVLYSDMGHVLASVTADTAGWHDPICGVSDAAHVLARYGESRYQEQRNAMHRNGKDSLLIELSKWGLGLRDLGPTLNLFSKVSADADGRLQFIAGHSAQGAYVELRFEMDTLLALSSAPHPFDPAPSYAPKRVGIVAWNSGTAGLGDLCRNSCPENQRGFANTELVYR
jgi:urea carboxylase-associated protein 2